MGQCWAAAELPASSKYLSLKCLGLEEQTHTLTYKGPVKEGPSSYLPSGPPPLLRQDGKEMAGGKLLLLIQPTVLNFCATLFHTNLFGVTFTVWGF